MNRRSLAATTIASVPVLFTMGRRPSVSALDQGTPAPGDQSVLILESLDGINEIAQREFYLQALTLNDLASTEPLAVLTAAASFDDDDTASQGLTKLRASIQDQLEAAIGGSPTRSKRTSAGSLGVENVGLDLQFAIPPDSSDVSVNTGIALIRVAAKVQVVVSFGFGDALASSIEIATALENGWNSDSLFDLLPAADALLPRLTLRVEVATDGS